MTRKRWVEKTHIHMAKRRFGILGCRNALRRITTGGEFQTIPGRREKALHGMRNGGFEVVGLVTLRLVSCLHQCDPIPFGGHADFFSAPGLTAYSLVKP
jgi:hypothetical protein